VATTFLVEIKRRNIIRAAAVYAAAGWLLVQVATQVFPLFHIDERVVRAIVVAVIAGLVPFIAFTWFYEITPSGLKRQTEVEPSESITHLTARKLDRWIIVLLVLIAALLIVQMTVLHKPAAPRSDAAPAESAAAMPAPQTTAPAKSIAVLPFENLSKDENNAYFATGMQDEILTRLAGIRDLKVISRTSTAQYASQPPNLKIVAEQLGVATVLEGSVQKAGDQVHINLQLINARDDTHLWAQSYNRDLKDIFAVEAEVAQNVADALKAQLLPSEAVRVAATPTQNEEAYELYLQGNAHANRAYDQDVLSASELPPAIALYEKALAADPQFALASAALARAHMSMYFNVGDRTEQRLAAAKTAADRALSLQPGLGEGHYALGLFHYWGHRNYAAAVEQLDLAAQTLPNSADTAMLRASIARRQGRMAEMIAGFRQAVLLDPRSAFAIDQLALAHEALRHYAEADRDFAQAEAITRDPVDERVTRALNTATWKGEVAPLRAALGALTPGSDPYTGNAQSFYLLHMWSGEPAKAIDVARGDGAESWTDQQNVALPRRLYLAWALQAAGDKGAAEDEYRFVEKTISDSLQQQPDRAELHLALAFAHAGLGRADAARTEGRKATELLPPSRDALTGASMQMYYAQVLVRVGDLDAAVDALQPMPTLLCGVLLSSAMLKLEPVWQPLRTHPRLGALIGALDKPIEIGSVP
jgi:TolB-like protein/Tfp pilus assembly protein PilF